MILTEFLHLIINSLNNKILIILSELYHRRTAHLNIILWVDSRRNVDK